MIIFVFIAPALLCLCFSATRAIRGQWKSSLIGVLFAVVTGLLFMLLLVSRAAAIRQAKVVSHERTIRELESRLEEKAIELNETAHQAQ